MLSYLLQAAGHVLLLDWITSKQFLSHFYWMLWWLATKLVQSEADRKIEAFGVRNFHLSVEVTRSRFHLGSEEHKAVGVDLLSFANIYEPVLGHMILGFRILSGNLGSNVWARGSSIFDLVRVLVVTYTCLEDLAEKAAVQEKCMVEEQKYSKVAQPKTRGTSASHKRTWEQDGASRCGRCRRQHFGEYLQCFNCGQFGHISKNCRKPPRTQIAAPAAPAVAVGNCFGCNQPGHIYRDCRRRGNAALPPPPKRPAIAPRVFAVGDPQGAEPIAVRGLVSVEGESAHTLFDMGASHSFMSPCLVKSWSFCGAFEPKAKQIQTVGTEELSCTSYSWRS
ncbi:hypothetical protein F2Q68_00043992 [Brassica cretica]|uniref:CCHC-type domain-containing protein n=2 Tax=Brassica cretica TaxID=69181 RepID=A0A8S9LP85_BRACR|nr:hypothetical protein F2Q68_00043992 [Brassica cretica]KAF3517213.1 hypothetical protein DY000_02060017 [Brassica cretica]